MEYEFEVIGKIIGKERPRVNMHSGMVYTPTKTKDYETLVQQYFKLKYPSFTELTGRVGIDIIAYLSIPKSTPKKNIPDMLDNKVSPTKKPDVDNIAKSILDAMNKFVIHDDNQVSKISIEKRYGEEEKVHIRIYEY